MKLKTNFTDGFQYIFRGDNIVNLVVLPGGFCFLSTMVMMIPIMFLGMLTPALSNGGEPSPVMMLLFGLFFVVFLVLFLLVMLWMYGYFWRIVGLWVTEGFETVAPSWLVDVPGYLKDGFKLFLYSLVLGILGGVLLLLVMLPLAMSGAIPASHDANMEGWMATGGLVFFFLGMFFLMIINLLGMPFLMAPMFYAAPQRSFSQLFALPQAFAWAFPNYGQVILVILAYVVIQIALIIIFGVIHVVTCGVGSVLSPFTTVPCALLYYYWLAEVYCKPMPLETVPPGETTL